MARKRRVLFHPLFVFLSSLKPEKRYRKGQSSPRKGAFLVGYVGLFLLTTFLCAFAVPVLSQTPPLPSPGQAIAQTSPITTSAQQLEQQARSYYAESQWSAAATAFEQAAQQYAAQGDVLRQSINLSNLALTYQQLGWWEEAGEAIASSLALVEAEADIQNSPARQSALAQALDIWGTLQLTQGQSENAIDTWERAVTIHQQLGNLEQAQESQINQARALQSLGMYSRAIDLLQAVLQPTAQSPPLLQALDDVQTWEQASALVELQERLEALPASPMTVAALRSLGEGLEVRGNLDQAATILQYGLAMAESLSLPEAIAATQLSLGNITYTQAIAHLRLNNMEVKDALAQLSKDLSPIHRELQRRRTQTAQNYYEEVNVALDYYEKAAQDTNPPLTQTQAQLNRLKLLIDLQRWSEADATIPSITALLSELPISRATFDAHINFAQSLITLADREEEEGTFFGSSNNLLQAAQVLATARQQAIALNNSQAESYALGLLGSVYQRNQQWAEAEDLTRQALTKVNAVSVNNLPQTVNDVDLAYRWQRQLGQLRDKQGNEEEAIAAYESALKMLQDRLRLDVASSNLNYQFSFGLDAQDPVHRELMDLLLRDPQPSQEKLEEVRAVSSSLLETQLTSFLQEPCNVATPQQVDTIIQAKNQKVALFYPIVLPDRLEVVVKLPGDGNAFHYRQVVEEDEFRQVVRDLKLALEEDYTYQAVNELSQRLYGWLIQPAETQLQSNQVDTLVFTLDLRLRSIPMAVLYDGIDYLIDKYAISEALGLAFEGDADPIPEADLKIMAAGLSIIPEALPKEIRDNFQPLTNVIDELEELNQLTSQGISVTTLPDEQFTTAQFNASINEDRFSVVHLATHGQFSANPKKTFLITYSTSDSALIDVDELASLFRVRGQIRLDSIELLVLNACETAAGDDLATLGIAGTAVRSGAKSAIASLWTLDDTPSVDFTKYLYENLSKPDVSRAEALRQAVLTLKQDARYEHPRYWAPYILAGNWLPLTTSLSEGSVSSNMSG